eukprot:4855814-Pyramimonas_sp.AAC.1
MLVAQPRVVREALSLGLLPGEVAVDVEDVHDVRSVLSLCDGVPDARPEVTVGVDFCCALEATVPPALERQLAVGPEV